MEKTGFSFAPSDAVNEVKKTAKLITQAKGGQGAVREVCELILKSKDLWKHKG
jgi:3-deoxy-D-manno-octulosonate 8-phosphate phosphatase KdsC-like HAD superfamily phosphatase